MTPSDRPASFTGRHMLFTMLAFFGVIITVNVTMAWFARSSWTGFVVENSYVASQQFNAKMAETRAQGALGWSSRLTMKDGTVRYGIVDAEGKAVRLDGVTLTFKRPVDDREDHTVVLARRGDVFEGSDDLGDGAWIVEIGADADLPNLFRETRRIQVRGGELQ